MEVPGIIGQARHIKTGNGKNQPVRITKVILSGAAAEMDQASVNIRF